MKVVAKSKFDLTMLFNYAEQFRGQKVKKTAGNELIGYQPNAIKHVYYSFISVLSSASVLNVYECLGLTVLTLESNGDNRLVLLTGSLEAWKNSVSFTFLYPNVVNHEIRARIEDAYIHFKNDEGLGFLWSEYTKTKDQTGQIKFIEKH